MSEAVFETIYECENCGDEWDEEHTPKTRVTEDAGRVVVIDTESDGLGDGRDVIVCPTCEMTKYVSVLERAPIENGDEPTDEE